MDVEERDSSIIACLYATEPFRYIVSTESFKEVASFKNDDGLDAAQMIVKFYSPHQSLEQIKVYESYHLINPNQRDGKGNTLLHLASHNPLLIKYLLDLGVKLESQNFEGLTPLEDALFYDKLEKADLLLESGAKVSKAFLKELILSRNEFGAEYFENVLKTLDKFV